MGGRFDATTAADAEIAAITRIDLDHQEFLGETLKEIAGEKAAIIRANSRVVVCDQSRIAMKVIRSRCAEVGAKVRVTNEFLGQGFGLPALGLLGDHQTENAQVAILLAYTLRDHFEVPDEAVTAGLEKARHSGRLEFHGRYLFDGAHNVGGAMALRAFLDEFVSAPVTMIFGAMKDKDVSEITDILFPEASNIVLTRPENSRAMSGEEILASGDALDHQRAVITQNVAEAIAKANEIAGNDSIILVTGSLYLIGEVKRILRSQFEI
jgi:dihydrofolate synthase/folylpolyglutamate synthase